MEKSSVVKLQNAGYTFLRPVEFPNANNMYVIKSSSEFGVWRKLGEFKSKAEMFREINRLINKSNLKYLA